MNINQLPIDCFLAILHQFPLQAQLHLREVCGHWCTVIEQDICKRKRSLTLFGSRVNVTDYCLSAICENSWTSDGQHLKPIGPCNDDIILDALFYSDEEEIFRGFLSRLFSDIQHLSIHLYRFPFEHLDKLLLNCKSLTHLSLSGSILHPNSLFTWKLCDAIDQLPCLKRLDLLTTDLFLREDRESFAPIEQLLYASLPKLEHFSLVAYKGNIPVLMKQLKHLKSLRLDIARNADTYKHLTQMITSCHQLSGLTHLRLSLPDLAQLSAPLIAAICDNLSLLECLDLQCCSFVNFDLLKIDANFIAQLNRLAHLSKLRMSHVQVDLNLLKGEHGEKSQSTILPSVKAVHLSQVTTYPRPCCGSLYTETSTNENLWCLVAKIFPQIEQLFIRVRKDAKTLIEQCLRTQLKKGARLQIYSVEDVLGDHFGRHVKCDDDGPNAEEFFSQSHFERLRHL